MPDPRDPEYDLSIALDKHMETNHLVYKARRTNDEAARAEIKAKLIKYANHLPKVWNIKGNGCYVRDLNKNLMQLTNDKKRWHHSRYQTHVMEQLKLFSGVHHRYVGIELTPEEIKQTREWRAKVPSSNFEDEIKFFHDTYAPRWREWKDFIDWKADALKNFAYTKRVTVRRDLPNPAMMELYTNEATIVPRMCFDLC